MRVLQFVFCILLSLPVHSQQWRNIGPMNRKNIYGGNGQGAGRMKSIAFHPFYGKPGTHGKTLFASSIHGGLWVSMDDGEHWYNSHPEYPGLSTDTLAGPGIRDLIAVNENGTLALYALSFHSNGSCLGVIRYTRSSGWEYTGFRFGILQKMTCYSIYKSAAEKDRIYVASDKGIFALRGKGETWELVAGSDGHTMIRNIETDPSDPKNLAAFGNKVIRSKDGGKTWEETGGWEGSLSKTPSRILQMYGVCADSGVLYVSVIYQFREKRAQKEVEDRQYDMLVFRNGTWSRMQMFPRHVEWQPDRQVLELSPDKKFLFAGQEKIFRCDLIKGGWTAVSDYGGNMHPDIHDLEFDSHGRLWVAHDGGVSVSAGELYSKQPEWKTLINGISSATIWSFSVSPKDPNYIATGEVDNGNTWTVNSEQDDISRIQWNGYGMADGGEKLIDCSDSMFLFDRTMMYANSGITRYRMGKEKIQHAGGMMGNARFQPHQYEDWATGKPLAQDPRRPHIIYRGVNGILRSLDGGQTSELILNPQICTKEHAQWQTLITVIEIHPKKTDIMYVNLYTPYDSSKTDGIFRTRRASQIPFTTEKGCSDPLSPNCECDYWTDMTPPLPPNLTVYQKHLSHIIALTVHDKNPNLVYAGYTYNPHLPGLKVMKYQFNVWNDYSEGLPEWTNVRCLEFIGGTKGTVFAGTDDGIYYRTEKMKRWERYGTGMPNVKVMGLQYVEKTKTLYAGTYGRGIWKVEIGK
ncbi:MAG: hypothetical protein IT242_07770 [Bacteroidia bacterium]|nr:hypothetical protein [Bacteroidia bacterium]